MSTKQTKCPECSTTYKVSVTQLTVAQGMVCCPKCDTNFNALKNLVQMDFLQTQHLERELNLQERDTSPDADVLHISGDTWSHREDTLLNIFDRKIEQSNINLRTYLNNLNYFNSENLDQLPVNLPAEPLNIVTKKVRKRTHPVLIWGTISIIVALGTLATLILKKPEIMHDSPTLTKVFTYSCTYLDCVIVDQRYYQFSFNKVRLRRINKHQTDFSGELVNSYERSLFVPNLVVTLKDSDQQVVDVYILKPEEYLIESLTGIQRIPTRSPFKFQFSLPVDRKSFSGYSLEIKKQ